MCSMHPWAAEFWAVVRVGPRSVSLRSCQTHLKQLIVAQRDSDSVSYLEDVSEIAGLRIEIPYMARLELISRVCDPDPGAQF